MPKDGISLLYENREDVLAFRSRTVTQVIDLPHMM